MLEVKQLRLARKWNQTELAYHAGLAPSVISQIENGKRDPTARTLRKLAKALEVEVADLFPKAQRRSSLEPSLNDALEEERRAAWEAAAEEARRLREVGELQMWRALSRWRASRERGEPYATRREYLDEVGNLLREVYDADVEIQRAYLAAALTTKGGSEASGPRYLQQQSRAMGHFYGKLFGLVESFKLTVLTGDDAAAAKQAAADEAAAEHVSDEMRPHSVEEDDAA